MSIQLPIHFEERLENLTLQKLMRAQLVDEICHAIIFTKIVFLLCAPYDSPPAYNEHLEKICHFIRSQDCMKVGLVVMNLICEGLLEEVFNIFSKYDIAPELFEIIIEDEHRHVYEADLYAEIGLPDQAVLEKKVKELEDLIISAVTLEPKYTIAFNALIGPEGVADFMLALHEKQTKQLQKIGMTTSDRWEIFFKIGPESYTELKPYPKKLKNEIDHEVYEIDLTTTRKGLMTQLNGPGDPTMVAQFNIDVSDFGFFENKYPAETITVLMMQALSSVLISNDSFRSFFSFNKLYQTRNAYISVIEKLPDCNDHLGTVHFFNCHEMTTDELLTKIKRSHQMMKYCHNKCAQIEAEYPYLKQRLHDMLHGYAHDVYPFPTPGCHSVLLSNIGSYGYSQATSPLLKQTGLHVLLLAIERKSVWNNETRTFEIKDLLPVSISADSRIFDGLLPIPDLINQAFQTALKKMQQEDDPTIEETVELSIYQKKIEELADELLVKYESPVRKKIIKHLVQYALFKEKKGLTGEEEFYLSIIDQHADFKKLADNLLLDYLRFNCEEAENNQNFEKVVDKVLAENLELAYRWLIGLQSSWVEYVDVEAFFAALFKKTAQSRLNKLAHVIPNILRRSKII